MYDWRDEKQYKKLKSDKEEIIKKYPLLYADVGNKKTCMAYGLDVGPGWLPLIDNLSKELEKEIGIWIDENGPNIECIICTRTKHNHISKWYVYTDNGIENIENIVEYTAFTPVDPENVFACEKFAGDFPRAAQVKEKFGGLRFYMTFATPKMHNLIKVAEHDSFLICEDCGNDGCLCTTGGWLRTLCPVCVSEYNSKGIIYTEVKREHR